MERYEKLRVIGQGAFGKVYLSKRKEDGSFLVIKQIPVDEMGVDERKASQTEVDVLAMLKHPNIIAYFDSFMQDKSMMIVMEYAPGGTLFDFIQERNGVLLNEEHILQVFVQVLIAIHHIHSLNILHRDLKTQNILLNKKRTVVKIGDFGISKVLSSKITSAQTVVGTPCYISPEICQGQVYGKKSDIWSLGCILYELTTLRKAFEGPNLPALVMRIMQGATSLAPMDECYSSGLKAMIHSTLQRNPSDRPDVEQVMAFPVAVNALVNLSTDVGRLPCGVSRRSLSGEGRRLGTRMGSLNCLRQRSFFEDDYTPQDKETCPLKPQALMWGGGVATPMLLPSPPDVRLSAVVIGRTQRIGLTEDGKLISWELSSGSLAMSRVTTKETITPRQQPLVFTPHVLLDMTSLVVKKVACGDSFMAFLTDKGIVMTQGSGSSGALGNGDCNDSPEPKLVQGMLSFETVEIGCGPHYVMAITSENNVFTWGKGDSGQLGLGTVSSSLSPKPVTLPASFVPTTVCCGTDSSILISTEGQLVVTGSNRYNKLALNPVKENADMNGPSPSPVPLEAVSLETQAASITVDKITSFQEVQSPMLRSQRLVSAAVGLNHTALVTDSGDCITCGSNKHGQLGFQPLKGIEHYNPTLVQGIPEKVTKVACGDFFTVVTTSGGKIFSWGKGQMGRLGRDTANDCHTPEAVPLNDVTLSSVPGLTCSHRVTMLLATQTAPL
ncbi:hypothetical protein EMCRGX_G019871 [Ephydatia muelleri]